MRRPASPRLDPPGGRFASFFLPIRNQTKQSCKNCPGNCRDAQAPPPPRVGIHFPISDSRKMEHPSMRLRPFGANVLLFSNASASLHKGKWPWKGSNGSSLRLLASQDSANEMVPTGERRSK